MKILVYGAGNIGSLYAARLQRAHQEVSILARGGRLARLREAGIELEDSVSGERSATLVDVVERLGPEDAYELVLVILPKNHVPEVLPALARNRHTPNVLFMCNNAEGPEPMVEALGRERVLQGFPGAGAVMEDGVVRYLIMSAREQPTTIGELDGRQSARIEHIAEVLGTAGFPVAICSNMDAWLKTHVAEVSPTANALMVAGGIAGALSRDREALRLTVQAIREGYRVLRAVGVPITPGNHRVFSWMPEWLLVKLMRGQFASEEAAIKVGHAPHARAEWRLLADEFQALTKRTGIPTPAIDRLRGAVGSEEKGETQPPFRRSA